MRSGSPGMATFPRVPPLSRQILPQPLALAQVTLPGLTAPGEWKSPRVRPPWHHARNRPEGVASRLALCFRHLSHNLVSISKSCSPGLQQNLPLPKAIFPPWHPLRLHSSSSASAERFLHVWTTYLPWCLLKCRFPGPTRDLRNHNFSRCGPGVSILI